MSKKECTKSEILGIYKIMMRRREHFHSHQHQNYGRIRVLQSIRTEKNGMECEGK